MYRDEKAKLLLRKKSLEEEIASLSHRHNAWLEPFQNWLNVAQNLDAIASDADLFAKKVCAKEIFGSNLRLGGKVIAVAAGDAEENGSVSVPTQWAALRAAHASVGQMPTSSILVPEVGLEPTPLTGHDFESCAATITPLRQVFRV